MARRKRSLNRRRRKRRGAKIFWTIVTFLIVAGAIIGSLTVFLKVGHIEVSGNTYYTAEQIIGSSGIEVGNNLFGVNKFEAIEQIEKDYPYIETVRITRKLPDTFLFEITERKPCGYVVTSDGNWIVDSKGFLLERVEGEGALSGAKIIAEEPLVTPFAGGEVNWATAGKKEALVTLLSELSSHELLDAVSEINLSAVYSMQFKYEDRITVILGANEELTKKLNMLSAVLPQLAPTDRGKLNLSNLGEARFTPERVVYDEK